MIAPSQTVKVLPKQMRFIQSEAKEVLYSGAFGTGKSRGLCYKVCRHASIPNNVVGLCRKTRVSLMRTTLRTLLLPDGTRPPVLPLGSYEHHKSDSIIELHGGGCIQYFGCDSPETVASMNLGACGVDEGIELDEDEYTMLLGRIRMDVDPIRPLFTATNPGPPSHFLHDRFFKEQSPQREAIHTTAYENFFLPHDYLETLSKLTGVRHQRYVLGKWIAFEGLVYDMFNRDLHVRHRDRSEFHTFYLFFDEGYVNPAVLLFVGEDGDGRLHVLDEVYERRMLQDKVVEHAMAYNPDGGCIGDPSAAGLIAAMNNKGLSAIGADNDVFNGIRALQQRLASVQDGRPRYSLEPHCSNHLLEFESYVWDEEKDRPVKELDHSMDAARYGVYYLDKDKISPHVASELEANDEEQLESDLERYERIMATEGAWNR